MVSNQVTTIRIRTLKHVLLLLILSVVAGGCSADEPMNPSFQLTLDDAKAALHEMQDQPIELERPLVVLGGIYDPGLAATSVANRFRRMVTNDDYVMSVSFFGLGTFEKCRDRLLERLQERFPSDGPGRTVEVDVIGISMGGIVARFAASPRPEYGSTLRIHRLFTISSPHRGANMADLPTLDRRAIDMRHDSEFMVRLDAAWPVRAYELIPYTRLDDTVVGAENTSPYGRNPWWVANIPGHLSHMFSMHDPRLMADIGRRLLGETPFTTPPAAPMP